MIERVRLDVDTRPVSNTLEDTFVRRDERWLLGAESMPGKYRDDDEPQSRPWAGSVPIAVARSGRLLVLTDRDGDVAPQPLADDIANDIRFDAEALGIAPSYDVLVDATTVGDAPDEQCRRRGGGGRDVPGRLVQHRPGWPAGRDADQGQPGRGGPGRR